MESKFLLGYKRPPYSNAHISFLTFPDVESAAFVTSDLSLLLEAFLCLNFYLVFHPAC